MEQSHYSQWEVYLRSTPGPYAQYNGRVLVYATSSTEAVEQAFKELKRGAFPDRGRNMWKVESVGRLHS